MDEIEVESAPNPFDILYTGEVREPVPETAPVVEDHVVPARIQSCVAGFALKDS